MSLRVRAWVVAVLGVGVGTGANAAILHVPDEQPSLTAAVTAARSGDDIELAAEAQFRLGMARKSQGDVEGAVDALVKLSILYGHAEWVQRGLYEAGTCYRELNQPQKAAKFFAELQQRFPDSPWNARAKQTTDKGVR